MLKHIKNLLTTSSGGMEPQKFCAGSGLVIIGDKIYAIADDALELAIFPLNSSEPGRLWKIFEGSLPENFIERKKVKPDLEVLTQINETTLLALPSGSTNQRMRGCLISLGNGIPTSFTHIDCKPLYVSLLNVFTELNIEGAVVTSNCMKLFQRGNGSEGKNAIINLKREVAMEQIIDGGILTSEAIEKITNYDLGKIQNSNLGFTDAAKSQISDKIFFLAAAENVQSTYDDGTFLGAVIGVMDSKGELGTMSSLDCDEKPEGLYILDRDEPAHAYIITDSDNPTKSSRFYQFFLK